ncbi:alpha/beta hydrolase [Leifsonia kafniensis]|uniref:Alpha/beta hydrolase n=1 Tax=Leifsonia kafniensis TaxID=475957 RepID=A0ABP7KXE8_9MICO
MTTNRPRIRRRVLRISTAVVSVLAVVIVVFLVWANSVMQGERPAALEVWRNPAISVTSTDHSIVMSPTENPSGTGLVFVPGARVDPYAYMYKLSGIVEETGATVVITKPTLNLALLDTRPLDTFTQDVAGISNWYVGGHSLGGVRACLLADSPEVTGLILFASYCANDLSASTLRVLSISGSDDGLSTPEKIEAAAQLLPDDTVFDVIVGANHASFGDYGVQPGDGTASLDSAQMRDQLTAALAEFGL